VGFGASSDSPRQAAQAETVHCCLSGLACTFGDADFFDALSRLLPFWHARITRVDLALDFFDGLPGSFERVQRDYVSGACDVRGKTPGSSLVGDFMGGVSRSFYLGSKGAGKQTNIYDKGHAYGDLSSEWQRVELRYGDSLRVIPYDVLVSPDAYFAGASPWHADLHAEALALADLPDDPPTPSKPEFKDRVLPVATVKAEAVRLLNWFSTTCAPSLSVLFKHLSADAFLRLLTDKLPARLQAFTTLELQHAFAP
jgi:phage replication initiation protein